MRCEIFAALPVAAEGLDFGLYYAYVMLCALHIRFIYIALKVVALVFTCCLCLCLCLWTGQRTFSRVWAYATQRATVAQRLVSKKKFPLSPATINLRRGIIEH